ncbi:hypothetical protein D3C79_679890 [compost metagenome]
MVQRRDRVLPDQVFLGYFGPQVVSTRAEVTVSQLEPGLGEGKFEFLGVVQEATRNFLVSGVETQRKVSGEHDWRMAFVFDVCVGNHDRSSWIGRNPLDCTCRTLGLDPCPAEEVGQVLIGEMRRT